jgi:hypothetical protein
MEAEDKVWPTLYWQTDAEPLGLLDIRKHE